MGSFFMFGRYSPEAAEKISIERTRDVHAIVERLGGKIKAIYAMLGEYDVVIVAEFPRMAEAMIASIQLKKHTGISFFTAAALPIEEFDSLIGQA